MECEFCQVPADSLLYRACMTNYTEPDRNREPLLCDQCAETYQEYWEERWNEFYSH
jgi:hypothetical protein